MSRALSEPELATAAAWLDGELQGEDLTRFEFALAADRELADAVERLSAADAWLRRHAARRDRARELRPWHIVVALLAVAALAFGLWQRLGRRPEMSARIVPGWPTAFEFAARRAELRGMRPPGFEVLRGQSAITNVAADDFLAAAYDVLEREARAPGIEDAVEAPGGCFLVSVVLPRPASVLVFAIPAEGPIARLFPAQGGENGSAQPARLDAGVHWLPAPPFRAGAAQTVDYSAGYVLPVEVEELEAVIVLAPAAFSADALQSLDADVARMIDGSIERRTAELLTALEKRRLGARAVRVRTR